MGNKKQICIGTSVALLINYPTVDKVINLFDPQFISIWYLMTLIPNYALLSGPPDLDT